MKSGKVWGNSLLIYRDESAEVHRIEIEKGGYCSLHKHETKHNMFFVESGSIDVMVEKKDYDLTDTTRLGPGEKMVVGPGEYHRFLANEDSIVYEIYYVVLRGDDIIRKDRGGKNPRMENGQDISAIQV